MAAANPKTSSDVPTLKSSVQELGRLVGDPNSELPAAELPGLDKLIGDWYDEDINVLEELPPQQQQVLEQFVAGDISAEQAGWALIIPEASAPEAFASQAFLEEETLSTAGFGGMLSRVHSNMVQAKRKQQVKTETNQLFENWGLTIKNTPATTYYPTTVAEIQDIVRSAVANNKGIRVSGFRHSWAPVFGRNDIQGRGNNGDVLISTISEWNASVLPNFIALPPKVFQPKKTDLNEIRVVDHVFVGGPPLSGGKKYIRVGTATTNEEFRRWCINIGHVTLPSNVILVEITMGGTNATICHGAGIKHPSLSDLIRCIEYVDVHGEVRTIKMMDPALKAASGCFGLLGVVTHITFECDAMSTALMRPMKLDVVQAIPPPPDMKDSDIPEALRRYRSPEQKLADQQEFEHRANNDYYAEWFWFPYSSQVWVNTWSTDASTENVEDYPSREKIFLQWAETFMMGVAQGLMKRIDALQSMPLKQTTFLSWLAMKNLDQRGRDDPQIRTLLPNALHFQRGIQNIRVRDLDVTLPLHPKKGTTNERDYSNVQRAWWDAIKACYDNASTSPMRMPLEMRIIGPSEVTMAPQRGHQLGSCAIEILTLKSVADVWEPFAQQVLDKWMSYKDNEGKRLVVKPHWAKEWYNFKVDNKPWVEKLKNEVYKDQIVEFRTLLEDLGRRHGWTLAELKKTFSNEFLDNLYFDDKAVF